MEASLHDDLLMQILLFLPIKSVIRFMCVSKAWYSLITSSTFVRLYNRTNAFNSRVLLKGCYSREHEFRRNRLCHRKHNLDTLCIADNFFDNFKIMGCVDGLICLSNFHSNRLISLIVWNPTIRRVLGVPNSDLSYKLVIGFGFDSVNDDYKIVKIALDFGQTEIFSLKKRDWKVTNQSASHPTPYSPPVYLNGNLYCLTYDKVISVFALSNDVFKEKIELPSSFRSILGLTVAVWRGFLSVYESGGYTRRVNWWVMKEEGVSESWVKQFVIESSFGFVQRVISNGTVVLCTIQNKLVLYNPEMNQFEELKNHDDVRDDLDTVSYVESLCLLDRADTWCQSWSHSLRPLETMVCEGNGSIMDRIKSLFFCGEI